MRKTLVTRTLIVVFALTSSAAIASAQDAEKGKAVYAAQKCSMCHSIAGAGSKANPLDGVGKKLSADDIRAVDCEPGRSRRQAQVHQEAAHAGEVRHAGGSRP